MGSPESGSEPLRGRKERFAVLLAEGMPQGRAYLESVDPPLEATAGRQVSASRLANSKLIQDRVRFLRRSRAEARASTVQPVNRASLIDLAAEVQTTLTEAAQAASDAGNELLATRLRKSLTVAAGRFQRLQRRAGHIEKTDTPTGLSGPVLLSRLVCNYD